MRYYARRRLRRTCVAFGCAVFLAWGGLWILRGVRLPDDTNPPPPRADTDEEAARKNQAFALAREAFERMQASDAAGALTLADAAAELEPSEAAVAAVHAEAYLLAGRFADALAEYRRAAELKPAELYYRQGIALALARLGDIAAAEEEVRVLLRDAPRFPSAQMQHASLLLALGDVDGARRALDIAIDSNTGTIPGELRSAEFLSCRGSLRVLRNGDVTGLDDLARAIRLNPVSAEHRLAMVIAGSHLGRPTPLPVDSSFVGDGGQLSSAIMDVYRRNMGPDLLLSQITERSYSEPEAVTTALYYLGEWFVLRGDISRAREQFQATLDQGLPYLCEFGLAKLRLAAFTPGTVIIP
jgi:tetratricopeptide (TPR) repeat protein